MRIRHAQGFVAEVVLVDPRQPVAGQRRHVVAPAEEMHAVRDPQPRCLLRERRAEIALAREPEMKARQPRHRLDQHIETFVGMKPP